MKNWDKVLLGLLTCVNLFTVGLNAEGMEGMQMSKDAKAIIANPKGTKESRGVTSLQDYIVEEQVMYDWLFKNHPIFTKYGGKTVGEMHVADRGKEFIAEGHGKDFSKASKRSGGEGVSSMMYRVARTSTLAFPNKFIGP
ncbi:MAG: cytochrome C, partial [Sulfurospirillum sp.]